MCYVIDSSQLLANYLAHKDEISIKDLNALAKQIQKSLPDVCVDVSHYSVDAAIEDFPDIFQWKDDITIVRPAESDKTFNPDYLFNAGMSGDLKTKFLSFFSS